MKLKLDKSKTELLMLFVQLKLPFLKVLCPVEEQLFFMLLKSLMILLTLNNSAKENLQELESFKKLSEFHA